MENFYVDLGRKTSNCIVSTVERFFYNAVILYRVVAGELILQANVFELINRLSCFKFVTVYQYICLKVLVRQMRGVSN